MDKTTIVHIITKLELGGAQQNTLFTVAHLDPKVYLPVLISGTEGILVEEAKQLKEVNVHFLSDLVREIKPLKDIKALVKIRRVLKQVRRGVQSSEVIVHTHSSKAGILGRWAARLAGIRLIVHSVHGFSFNDYQPLLVRTFYILLERLTALITTAFVTVSGADREEGIRKGIFKKDDVTLIRSGIDLQQFNDLPGDRISLRRKLGIGRDVPAIAMVACFKPQKAPLDFVRVAKKVSDERDDALFYLVGDGLLRPQVEKLIEELNIGDKVRLLGWRRDIPEIMRSIDLLVLTSLWEGLPRVLPQAMASGVPVVATNVNGAPEAIRNGLNGYLLPPGDVAGMAKKILYLINNPEEAHAMGRKGRELVEEFDIWKMVKQQEVLYQNLSAGGILDGAG
jgi:glycosyltransferase involved in cell wall biosynthesis